MKPLLPSFVLAAAALTGTMAPSAPYTAQALGVPDVIRLTGCTKDGMTASTHIGVFGSIKSHDETRAVLNRHFRALAARYAGKETQTDAFSDSVIDTAGKAAAGLGPDASVTKKTFYSNLKPGCDPQA
ncbi:MAG: hypothetical protein HY370_01955, partial [Proteobacteria bacterium]|nr:hypothetical protein [Pseudomonadota bacterium]